jgi:type VI secretion system protein ImpL
MIINLLRRFASPIGTTIMLSIALTIAVWFLGPLAGTQDWVPLAGSVPRLVCIASIWFVALLIILFILLRRAKKSKAMEEDIVESAALEVDMGDEVIKAELGDMKDKLKTAMTALRKSKMGRKSLYELPWYVMIGPPGAGSARAAPTPAPVFRRLSRQLARAVRPALVLALLLVHGLV